MSHSERQFGTVKSRWWLLVRLAFGIIALLCCYRLVISSGKTGVARFFCMLSIIQSSVEPADNAVRVTPDDPEAHYTRALALVNVERLTDAVVELRRAIQLRPNHYYQWLDLGVTLDRLGDFQGAENALRESVRLAPYFGQPRWQLGNFLYRQGRNSEAFVELRQASRSNQNMFPQMLVMAWSAAADDIDLFNSFVQPQSTHEQFQVAEFLANQRQGKYAAMMVERADTPSDDAERYWLRQTIAHLLANQQFSDAYAVWGKTHKSSFPSESNRVVNGDLTQPIPQDDPGFGWQLITSPSVAISVDPSGPTATSRSFRFDFNGDIAVGAQVVSQLVLVAPNTRYSMRFMAKSEGLATGGPLLIEVRDVTRPSGKILGQSKFLAVGTTGWSPYEIEFSTDQDSTAIMLSLQRSACKESICPIFGRLSMGAFLLAKAQRS
jgi:Tfp pilus assembly protein PilF